MRINSLLSSSLLILTSIIVSLGLSEILVRSTGRIPITVPEKLRNEPVIHMYDDRYGWINKPGNYLVPGYTPDAHDIVVNFNPDSSRYTGINHNTNDYFIFLGGSYTQGWAVSDSETFSYLVQSKKPNIKIKNHGVGGYGTYQSLLLMKDLINKHPSGTTYVYYYFDHHEKRNVATASWLRSLASSSKRGHIATPYVSMTASSTLKHHPPEKYFTLPFRTKSALIAFTERVVMKITTRDREGDMVAITMALITEMNELAYNHGMKFKVVILSKRNDTDQQYFDYLKSKSVQVRDCRLQLTEDLKVKGEGHPNPDAHRIWASCISPIIG